jgi:hypothetical protein
MITKKILAEIGTYTVSPPNIGFVPPSFQDILTFGIRLFFVIAGLAALFYLLLGALGWITSGGSKEGVDKAREKITAAVIGLVLVFVVFGIVALLEVVLNRGFGVTKSIDLPTLIKTN